MLDSPTLNIKTTLIALTTILLWSSAFVGIRAGLHSYSPGCLALLRYGIASIAMLPLYFNLKTRSRPKPVEIPSIFTLGVIGFGIYNITLNYGEITVAAGTSCFILSLMPVAILLLAKFFLNEKLSNQAWLGTLVSIVGVGIITYGESTNMHFDWGVIFILIATFSGSFYSVFHKPFLRKYHPIELTAYAIWSGTVLMLIYLPNLLIEFPKAQLGDTLWIVYLGIFPAVVGYICWAYVIRYINAGTAGSFLYIMPITTTIMGWLFLGELPRLSAIIGGVIALIGAGIASSKTKSSYLARAKTNC